MPNCVSKEIQRRIRGLLEEGEIDKALEELHQERGLRSEHKKDLERLMH